MEMISCPQCGENHIDFQIFQENIESQTTEKTRTRYQEVKKKHGMVWWILIGWWYMVLFGWIVAGIKFLVKSILWIVAFVPMALLRIGRKRTYEGETVGVTKTTHQIQYRRICVCKDCGYTWEN